MIRTSPLVAATALLLAGCASDPRTYPSLAPRPIEKLGFAEPEAATPAPVAPDPVLDDALAAITLRLDAVVAGHDGDAARATAAATRARGAPIGSEAWLDAQAALATLDDWRAQASAIVTDLDRLASDRAGTLAPDYPALAPLRARAQTELVRQEAAILQLQARLPAA
jgi:hypothetical protein